ncbi:chloramphenicol phosphotransferase CPT family protein [Devosia sp. SL43]|uniref:chloramphenicol phosphotransferase CPT family protein n=1 Tax=Devosia sp. SL43 TaxID=2806348 RepID=UPI001F18E724|nr:AAA family ATPase [Devosia sp. SL43]UJW86329.1 AAA family ATPase [Devosia sp. SL43]
MTASIIFLHGASSSGKSTIAAGLQANLPLPFWHISIDHLRDAGVLPTQRFKSGEFDWKAARAPFFDGFHRSLAAYVAAGNNLILEHILDTNGWLEQLVELLSPFDVFFVGVHCPLDELIRREALRGDRPVGSAARDFETIHRGLSYDFEVQSDRDAAENVAAIIDSWTSRTGDSVFARLASKER